MPKRRRGSPIEIQPTRAPALRHGSAGSSSAGPSQPTHSSSAHVLTLSEERKRILDREIEINVRRRQLVEEKTRLLDDWEALLAEKKQLLDREEAGNERDILESLSSEMESDLDEKDISIEQIWKIIKRRILRDDYEDTVEETESYPWGSLIQIAIDRENCRKEAIERDCKDSRCIGVPETFSGQCDCSNSCDSQDCAFQQQGGECGPECSCQFGTACKNPLNSYFESLFVNRTLPKARMCTDNVCLTDFIHTKKGPVKKVSKALMKLIQSSCKSQAVGRVDEWVCNWEVMENSFRGPAHKYIKAMLVQYALALDGEWRFSLCHGKWVEAENTVHCSRCRTCVKTSDRHWATCKKLHEEKNVLKSEGQLLKGEEE